MTEVPQALETAKRSRQRRIDPWMLLALLAGLSLAVARFSGEALHPQQLGWVLAHGDSAMNQLGWEFFRAEGWQHPIGAIERYQAPAGTSIGLTDSIPLLAIPLKLLRFLLPERFQYLGLWLLLCYGLQGMFGYLLARRLTQSRILALLGAGAFLLLPIFLTRQGHAALEAQWLLLWAFYNCFGPPIAGWKSLLRRWLPLWAIAAWVHPYLMVMVVGITLADSLGRALSGELHWSGLAIGLPLMSLAWFGLWYEAGYLLFPDGYMPGVARYTDFAMNLNALWNPLGTSALFVNRPIHWGGEGFNYLGLGVLLLGAAGLAGVVGLRLPWRRVGRHLPLALLLFGFACVALSNQWKLDERIVKEWVAPPMLLSVLEILRGSGRFFWPVSYALVAGALFCLSRVWPRRVAVTFLVVVLGLQAIDLSPILGYQRELVRARLGTRLHDARWEQLLDSASSIRALPPWRCNTLATLDFIDFAQLALRHGADLGVGYSTRISRSLEREHEAQLRYELSHAPDDDTIYLLQPDSLRHLTLHGSLRLSKLDEFVVAWPRANPVQPRVELSGRARTLGEYLQDHADATVLLAVMDEASRVLDDASKEYLSARGSEIDRLGYRDSYLAILHHGSLLAERISHEGAVALDLDVGAKLGEWSLPKRMHLESAGLNHGNRARIEIDAVAYGRANRGFNVVVCDDALNVLELAHFDTYLGPLGFRYLPAEMGR